MWRRSRVIYVLLAALSHRSIAGMYAFQPGLNAIGGCLGRSPLLSKTAPAQLVRLASTTRTTRRAASPINREAFALPPSEKVLKAVEKAGGRVTAQDVAALAGVDLSTAQKDLVKLASLVDGDLEVSIDGDLVYNFPAAFRTALRARSTTQQAKEIWEKVWPSLFYMTRVSFGLVLVLSIALVFATIAFGTSASVNTGDNRDDDDRRRRGGVSIQPMFWFDPFDFFLYRPYGYYYTQPQMGNRRMRPEGGMGFLESCFSYIFGDGDPNARIDDTRYRLIADVIRRNGGAVIAEQLAPFLDPPPLPGSSSSSNALSGSAGGLEGVVDESFVLSVLTRLNGRPEVTREGNIVYVFPELMTSAVAEGGSSSSSSRWARMQRVDRELLRYQTMSATQLRDALRAMGVPTEDAFDKAGLLEILKAVLLSEPSSSSQSGGGQQQLEVLEEQKVPFSVAPTQNLVMAGILGVVNIGGVLALGNVLRTYGAAYGAKALPGLLGLSQALYAPLVIYAVGFNLIPLVRSIWLKEQNAEIEARNERRRGWAKVVNRAVGPLYEKVLAARNYRSQMKVLSSEDMTYSTARSATEQRALQEAQDLREFDRKVASASSSPFNPQVKAAGAAQEEAR